MVCSRSGFDVCACVCVKQPGQVSNRLESRVQLAAAKGGSRTRQQEGHTRSEHPAVTLPNTQMHAVQPPTHLLFVPVLPAGRQQQQELPGERSLPAAQGCSDYPTARPLHQRQPHTAPEALTAAAAQRSATAAAGCGPGGSLHSSR